MAAPRRIVSLLPSATEIVADLGCLDRLVGRSAECAFPDAVRSLPVVTAARIDTEALSSEAIDAAVRASLVEGRSLYSVDGPLLERLAPDLVITQDLCRVCAVSSHELRDLEALEVETLALDPPYRAGHWTPDLLRLAEIFDPLARAGIPSIAGSWDEVIALRPELLVLAPCGFDRERALQEADLVRDRIEATGAARVAVLDGSAYFNRPGPRLVDSLEVLVRARA